MIHEAFGDHQVANVQTETLARTLGAEVRAGGRRGPSGVTPDLFSSVAEPFYAPGQELVESAAFNRPGGLAMDAADAVAFTIDTGPIRAQGGRTVGTLPNPDWNIAPVDASPSAADDGLGPHEPAATSPAARRARDAAPARPGRLRPLASTVLPIRPGCRPGRCPTPPLRRRAPRRPCTSPDRASKKPGPDYPSAERGTINTGQPALLISSAETPPIKTWRTGP